MNELTPLHFWCQKTLPLVYDDSLSYMELLCKVVAYLNNVITEVNELKKIFDGLDEKIKGDIYKVFQEMKESGELSDLINAVLFNDKVDRYKTQYAAIGYANTGVASENSQDFFIVKLHNKGMIIDSGFLTTSCEFNNVIKKMGLTRADYFYISHYHEDHIGNFENVCNAIECEGATVFCPPAPNATWDTPRMLQDYATFIATAQAHNMTLVRPTEGQIFTLTDYETIQFFNTNPEVYYKDGYNANDTSMCGALSTNGSICFFDGDIMAPGEEYITPVLSITDIMCKKVAHHGYNPKGYTPYFDKLNAKNLICTDGNGTSNDGYSNFINLWGSETLWAQQREVPLFATSTAPNYVLYWEVGENYFHCDSSRYNLKRVNRKHTALIDITNVYTVDASKLSIPQILDMMEDGELFFHAPSSYKCCPAEYSNGVFMRIYKNSSSNSQFAWLQNDKIQFANIVMQEHGSTTSQGNAEDTTFINLVKGPNTNQQWICSVQGMPNFYQCNLVTVPPATTLVQLGAFANWKGDDWKIINGVWTCQNIGYYKFDFKVSIVGPVDTEYNYVLQRLRNGGTINICGITNKKPIAAEQRFYALGYERCNVGDTLQVVCSNTGSGNGYVGLMVSVLAYGWGFGRDQILNPQ